MYRHRYWPVADNCTPAMLMMTPLMRAGEYRSNTEGFSRKAHRVSLGAYYLRYNTGNTAAAMMGYRALSTGRCTTFITFAPISPAVIFLRGPSQVGHLTHASALHYCHAVGQCQKLEQRLWRARLQISCISGKRYRYRPQISSHFFLIAMRLMSWRARRRPDFLTSRLTLLSTFSWSPTPPHRPLYSIFRARRFTLSLLLSSAPLAAYIALAGIILADIIGILLI